MSAMSVPTDHVPRRSTAVVSIVTRTAPTGPADGAVGGWGGGAAPRTTSSIVRLGAPRETARRKPRRACVAIGGTRLIPSRLSHRLGYNHPRGGARHGHRQGRGPPHRQARPPRALPRRDRAHAAGSPVPSPLSAAARIP